MAKVVSARTARIGGVVAATVLLSGLAGWGGGMLANSTPQDVGATSAAASTPAATTTPEAPVLTPVPPEPTVVSEVAPTSDVAPPPLPSAAPTTRSTPLPRPSAQPAPPPVPVPVPAPAAEVAPTPIAAPAPPSAYVNCSAYLFAKEDLRNSYLAKAENNNIQFNIALNTGDLDTAAMYSNTGAALQRQQSTDEQRLKAQYPGC